jgi:hypothetical protein
VRDLVLRLREEPKTKRLPVMVIGCQAWQRNEISLYQNLNLFCVAWPLREQELPRNLALAVLGKLR